MNFPILLESRPVDVPGLWAYKKARNELGSGLTSKSPRALRPSVAEESSLKRVYTARLPTEKYADERPWFGESSFEMGVGVGARHPSL